MQHNIANGATIYEIGLKELHRVSTDESARKIVDTEFTEARGRETARLHVTLKAIAEQDARTAAHAREVLGAIERVSTELQDRAAQLSHLIESFESMSDKRFTGVHDDLRTRADALTALVSSRSDGISDLLNRRSDGLVSQVREFASTERDHFEGAKAQVADFRAAAAAQLQEARTGLWTQADNQFVALQTQGRESTERAAVDVRNLRDEVVRLVDSRMNQADASFAAIRGDLEVVKFLVMDIIKDRIGRTDPKAKPF